MTMKEEKIFAKRLVDPYIPRIFPQDYEAIVQGWLGRLIGALEKPVVIYVKVDANPNSDHRIFDVSRDYSNIAPLCSVLQNISFHDGDKEYSWEETNCKVFEKEAIKMINNISYDNKNLLLTTKGIQIYEEFKYRKDKENLQKDKLRAEIFISYCHKDNRLFNEFKVFLKLLERKYKFLFWDDSKIKPGTKWKQKIELALGRAKVTILLVFPDFLASDFIMDKELPYILNIAETEGVHIVWIPFSHSLYKETPASEYQAVVEPNLPLDHMSKSQRNKTFTQICENLLIVMQKH